MTSETDQAVYWCRHCGEQVGTTGGEPTEDCPTCGNADWKPLVTDAERTVGSEPEQ